MPDGKAQAFPTSDGRLVAVKPVDMTFGIQLLRKSIEDRFKRAGEPVLPPTYTVTTASGATETFPHDETTLQTDDDKAAWAKHTDAKKRMEAELSMAFMRYTLLSGVVCEEPTKEWQEQCTFLGLDLPENASERKLLYMQMMLLPTPADLKRAMAAVLAVSSTGSEEMVHAAEDLFRHSLQGPSVTLDQSTGG